MKRLSAKAVVIAALAIACALALAACGGQSSSSSSSNIQEKTKIVIGYDKYNFGTETGQGFTDSLQYKNIIKSALDELGWEAEFKGIEFADVEKSINDGTIDCYWNSYTIQGRENLFAWSEAYQETMPAIVYKKADGNFGDIPVDNDIATISNLPSNKAIAVKAGTVTYEDLPVDQKAIVDSMGTLKEYQNLTQCKEALDKGEVDMVLTEVQITSPLFDDYDTYGYVFFAPSDSNTYGVAFKKGNDGKAKAITDALRTVYSNGTIKTNYINYCKSVGYDSATTDNVWKMFAQDWLLKDKVIVGYASDNYGTETGQGYTDSLPYNTYIKPTLEKLGWEVESKGIPYADIEKSINDGTIDCFWDSYSIQGREEKYAWSAAYTQARPVLMWKNANGTFETKEVISDITTLSTLPSGKTIGVKAGSVTYANLPADQKAIIDSIGTLKEYPGLIQCREALDKGEIDMVLTEAALITPLFADAAYSRTMFDVAGTNSYGVAFKKGSEDKAQSLSEALKNIHADGTFKEVCLTYLRSQGLGEVDAQQAWSKLDDGWLLK